MSTSLVMTAKRTMPWIIAGIPDGWISRPARMSAPKRIDATITPSGWKRARYAMMIAVNP